MTTVNRRVTCKLYRTALPERTLRQCDKLDCDLVSADAYRLAGRTVGFAAPCKSLTEIRADHPEYRARNARLARATFKRLDLTGANVPGGLWSVPAGAVADQQN